MTLKDVQEMTLPAYPEITDAGHAEKLIDTYKPKVEALNSEIIAAHERGDHEVGDALRPKLAILRRHLEDFGKQKAIFERG